MESGSVPVQARERLSPNQAGPGGADSLRGPERTCLGCRARKNQADLDRLALTRGPGGSAVVRDVRRRLGGRGAWLCRGSRACLASAIKKRVFGRAFRVDEALDLTALYAEAPEVADDGGRVLNE